MPNYTKYKECPVCGKNIKARGIGAHLRLAHELKITERQTIISTKNIPPADLSRDSSQLKSTPYKSKETDLTPDLSGVKEIIEVTREYSPVNSGYFTQSNIYCYRCDTKICTGELAEQHSGSPYQQCSLNVVCDNCVKNFYYEKTSPAFTLWNNRYDKNGNILSDSETQKRWGFSNE